MKNIYLFPSTYYLLDTTSFSQNFISDFIRNLLLCVVLLLLFSYRVTYLSLKTILSVEVNSRFVGKTGMTLEGNT